MTFKAAKSVDQVKIMTVSNRSIKAYQHTNQDIVDPNF